ncbi:MAG: TonB-dependent receptor [Bacteroidales bacterium]|nr:TonB-dependent receptor [Bacteroidales bacterium]MBN2698918.1 TonB-dependent receptor [Bacteroidales bacterium]
MKKSWIIQGVCILWIAFLFDGNLVLAFVPVSDTIELEEVVISGNRIEVARSNVPISVNVISRNDIRGFENTNVLPMVTQVSPSLFISEIGVAGYPLGNGTSGQLSIRGVSGQPNARVLILVDGQPQYMGVFGHPLPNFHVAQNVERVEVVRGPASLMYGSNAMGGLINVITRKKVNDGISGFLNFSYGSYNTLKGNTGITLKKGNFDAGIVLNHDRTTGHRDSSRFNISNLNLFFGYRINDHWKMDLSYKLADYYFEDPGSIYNPSAIAFLGDIARHMADFSLTNKHERTEGGLFAFFNSGHHDFSDGWESNDMNAGINLYQGLKLWRSNLTTVGFDYKRYGGEGSSGLNANRWLTIDEIAGYIHSDQSFTDWLSITAGLRMDHNSNFGAEWIPQFGFVVKPFRKSSLRGNLSKGFRSPTIMELYLFAPNPALLAEEMWNYELAYTKRWGAMGMSTITGFLLNGSNLIVMEPNPNPGPPMWRINRGAFKHMGVELENKFNPVEYLKAELNYNYLYTESPVLFAPEHKLYAGLAYSPGKYGVYLTFSTIINLKTEIDGESGDVLHSQSYYLLGLKIFYRPLDWMEIYLSGSNLLNQDYQTVYGYPMPGINFIGGIALDFK